MVGVERHSSLQAPVSRGQPHPRGPQAGTGGSLQGPVPLIWGGRLLLRALVPLLWEQPPALSPTFSPHPQHVTSCLCCQLLRKPRLRESLPSHRPAPGAGKGQTHRAPPCLRGCRGPTAVMPRDCLCLSCGVCSSASEKKRELSPSRGRPGGLQGEGIYAGP